MHRKSMLAWPLVCALAVASCSGTPQTLVSPSGVSAELSAVNPDGSTVKVGAPSNLSPSGGVTVDTLNPTLSFTNPTGRFTALGLAFDIEVVNGAGTIVYERTTGESSGTTSHPMEAQLTYSDNFWFRSRGRIGSQVGPWSEYAAFRTLDRPGPPPPPPPSAGGLPFAIPAECGPGDPGNRFACAAAIASQSVEWQRCAGGQGVGCHRFTRQVVYALSRSDPNWAMIQASPGGHACNCFGCGPSDGTMQREDTGVYAGRRVFDMIVGAGGPSPSLNWSEVPGPRSGDIPVEAQVCVP